MDLRYTASSNDDQKYFRVITLRLDNVTAFSRVAYNIRSKTLQNSRSLQIKQFAITISRQRRISKGLEVTIVCTSRNYKSVCRRGWIDVFSALSVSMWIEGYPHWFELCTILDVYRTETDAPDDDGGRAEHNCLGCWNKWPANHSTEHSVNQPNSQPTF